MELPLHQTVAEEIGSPVTLNICVLGTLIGMCGIVKKKTIEKTLAKKFPPAFMARAITLLRHDGKRLWGTLASSASIPVLIDAKKLHSHFI